VKPMFIDEAVLQMAMSTKQFLVFLNAKSERVNVIYRRKNGDFGLIEPTFT
jgi:putative sigma-54 modulation protein